MDPRSNPYAADSEPTTVPEVAAAEPEAPPLDVPVAPQLADPPATRRERQAQGPRPPRLPPLVEDGLLLVDKHRGCTSHDIVQQVRRILRQKKIGHCGTLDPEATGLLVLTLGHATRLTRFLIRAPKVYEGVVHFGTATNTYDAAGDVTSRGDTSGLTETAIAEAMTRFVGTYEQTPPPFCARKVGGVRFYELARRGEDVPETTKEVTVYDYAPISPLEHDELRVRIACTSGTYARTLAHDLGQAVGCGAHLSGLRRLKIGGFELATALTVDELARRVAAEQPLAPSLIPFDAIPLPFAEAPIDVAQERRLTHGQTVLLRDQAGDEGDWVKLVTRRGQFLAVGSVTERIGASVVVVQPRIVFR